ncbi:tropomyosin-2-like [Palaemon carinicauda]|uniref:tropomyosin-2-like n=1 Tax=Palaemon carinicauda TaxID=392227 RepID=UPI0035B5C7B8
MARLEIAESQNDELREELSSKTFVQVREIDVCNNIGNLALMDDLHRANNNIESLFVSLEKLKLENDQIRDELLAKAYVETELENSREEIRILEKKLERVTRDLETANERADKKIKDLMARLEIAESQNDELREELSSKTFVQVREIDVCNNIGNLALMDDLHRANNNIESLFVSLEKAEARNDQIRDELLAKAYVETELENSREEIRILEREAGKSNTRSRNS